MGFASSWIISRTLFPEFIKEAPDSNTGIIAVIPSCNEPAITSLLDSLEACIRPSCNVEVIVVVNAPADAGEDITTNNSLTLQKIESWKENNKSFFRLFVINIEKPSLKGWGVGLARKTGMDEALRRFNDLELPEGVIACLDGDCTVSSDYFISLENELLSEVNRNACSVRFEHPLSGKEFHAGEYNAILQYEIHLRYYYQALKYCGFPQVYHTVGSTIAVKALAYMKSGGMNRREAGEDFYFVQKLIPSGGYFSLNSATVYPSPRISGRVPFGTGHAVGRMIEKGEKEFMTYHPSAFEDLRSFFTLCSDAYCLVGEQLDNLYCRFPEPVKIFLPADLWKSKIMEISANTSTPESFRKRFYEWFNMFRIVKFLNSLHQHIYKKIPAAVAAKTIISMSGYDFKGESEIELLNYLRELEIRF